MRLKWRTGGKNSKADVQTPERISGEDVRAVEGGALVCADRRIDLAECARNYAAQRGAGSGLCVGERRIDAKPPYIELYVADKPVRIVFPGKDASKEFRRVQLLLQAAGYRTFDLS